MLESLLIACLFALLFATVAAGGVGWRRSADAGFALSFFMLFFLLVIPTWIGGLWIVPFGPYYYGTVSVLPFFFVACGATLLILAAMPPSSGGTGRRDRLVR